ncbi:hypothetical protein L5515_010876 [Caenorhabditis briggsae]|uniref:C-type lectin domain-containing protein n=2 Tax=Caenorhabditis briggsae TaxID=6238 RepID=A0AAE9ETX8_CAEBR|nr:hypothetical protein L5515_010876 [Caenorhabditis briggsae]
MVPLLFFLSTLLALPTSSVVIPSPLKSSYQSISGQRAINLDVNVRLLTVLALQQSGWQLYEDHWYKLFETDLMWIPAENVCRSMGGHLVSIKDESENLFVHKLRKKNNVWIGLNKLNDTFQVYKWSDGTEADYLNWDSSQPNEPEVDCAYMAFHQEQRGTWFDYGCREMLPQFFVCELPMP